MTFKARGVGREPSGSSVEFESDQASHGGDKVMRIVTLAGVCRAVSTLYGSNKPWMNSWKVKKGWRGNERPLKGVERYQVKELFELSFEDYALMYRFFVY